VKEEMWEMYSRIYIIKIKKEQDRKKELERVSLLCDSLNGWILELEEDQFMEDIKSRLEILPACKLNLRADISFSKSELADLDTLFMKGLKRISEIKKEKEKEAKEYQRLLQIDDDSYFHYLKSLLLKLWDLLCEKT
jgi:hypothetical protein